MASIPPVSPANDPATNYSYINQAIAEANKVSDLVASIGGRAVATALDAVNARLDNFTAGNITDSTVTGRALLRSVDRNAQKAYLDIDSLETRLNNFNSNGINDASPVGRNLLRATDKLAAKTQLDIPAVEQSVSAEVLTRGMADAGEAQARQAADTAEAQARQAADQTLSDRIDKKLDILGAQVLRGRDGGLYEENCPGEGYWNFTSDASVKESSAYQDLDPSARVGGVYRVTSELYVIAKEFSHLLPNDVYPVQFVFTRTRAPVDPSGDSVWVGLLCYDSVHNPVGDVPLGKFDALVTGTLMAPAYSVTRSGTTGFDAVTVLPAGTTRVRPYVRVFGGTQQTDVDTIAWNKGSINFALGGSAADAQTARNQALAYRDQSATNADSAKASVALFNDAVRGARATADAYRSEIKNAPAAQARLAGRDGISLDYSLPVLSGAPFAAFTTLNGLNTPAAESAVTTFSRNSQAGVNGLNSRIDLVGANVRAIRRVPLSTLQQGIVVSPASSNELTNTDITSAGWTKSGTLTATGNYARAPNNTNTAIRVKDNGNTSEFLQRNETCAADNTWHRVDLFVKPQLSTRVRLQLNFVGGTTYSAIGVFDLVGLGSVNSITATGGGACKAEITPFPDGWYAIGVYAPNVPAGTSRRLLFYPDIADSATTGDCLVWYPTMVNDRRRPGVVSPRGADVLAIPLTGKAFQDDIGTVVMDWGDIPDSNIDCTLLTLDDGSVNNYFRVWIDPDSLVWGRFAQNGGTPVTFGGVPAGRLAARWALAWNSAGVQITRDEVVLARSNDAATRPVGLASGFARLGSNTAGGQQPHSWLVDYVSMPFYLGAAEVVAIGRASASGASATDVETALVDAMDARALAHGATVIATPKLGIARMFWGQPVFPTMGQSLGDGGLSHPEKSVVPSGKTQVVSGVDAYMMGNAVGPSTEPNGSTGNPPSNSYVAYGGNVKKRLIGTTDIDTPGGGSLQAYHAAMTPTQNFNGEKPVVGMVYAFMRYLLDHMGKLNNAPGSGMPTPWALSGCKGGTGLEYLISDTPPPNTIDANNPGPYGYNFSPWMRFQSGMQQLRALINSADSGIPAWLFMQGEANDYSTYAEYYGYLTQIRDKVISRLAQAIFGQTYDPLMLMYQTNNKWPPENNNVPRAQLAFALSQPNVAMFGPSYPVTSKMQPVSSGVLTVDNGHKDGNGSLWLGCMAAKVLFKILVLNQGWEPMRMLEVNGRSGSKYVYVSYHTPTPPLTFRECFYGYRRTMYANKGLWLYDVDLGGYNPISSVDLANNRTQATVRLTLGKALGSTPGSEVRYAINRLNDPNDTVGRGNIADSDPTLSPQDYKFRHEPQDWASSTDEVPTSGNAKVIWDDAVANLLPFNGKQFPLTNYAVSESKTVNLI